jgi:hypothetical protein
MLDIDFNLLRVFEHLNEEASVPWVAAPFLSYRRLVMGWPG